MLWNELSAEGKCMQSIKEEGEKVTIWTTTII